MKLSHTLILAAAIVGAVNPIFFLILTVVGLVYVYLVISANR